MDSITQGLLGGAIGEAGFRDELGGRAVAWGAFIAVAPDLDMLVRVLGEWETVIHHRGMSHSWVCQSLAAPVLGYLAWRFIGRRAGTWRGWAFLTWWALVTHPALDTCTAYGTQLFAPLSTYRFAIDAVSIIDPLYSIPLLIAVLFAWRSRNRRRSRRVAVGALALSTSYLAAGWGASQWAEARAADDLAARGFSPTEIRALPTLGNVVVHRVIARDDHGGFRVAILSATHDARRWYALDDEDDPLIERAERTDYGVIYDWFAMGFARYTHEPADDGDLVRIQDLRFGGVADPTRTFMGAELLFDRRGRLVEARRGGPPSDLDLERELSALWAHAVGEPLD